MHWFKNKFRDRSQIKKRSKYSGVTLALGAPFLAEILRPFWIIWRPFPSSCLMSTSIFLDDLFLLGTSVAPPARVISAPIIFRPSAVVMSGFLQPLICAPLKRRPLLCGVCRAYRYVTAWNIIVILNFCKESVSIWQFSAYESGDLTSELTSVT